MTYTSIRLPYSAILVNFYSSLRPFSGIFSPKKNIFAKTTAEKYHKIQKVRFEKFRMFPQAFSFGNFCLNFHESRSKISPFHRPNFSWPLIFWLDLPVGLGSVLILPFNRNSLSDDVDD